MLIRLHRGRQHLHHLRRNTLQLHQLIGGQRAGAKAADRERRAVEGQRRNDGVHTRAVRQTRIDHWRRLVHAAPHAGDDAVDDLQQMAVVAERSAHLLQQSAFFHKHVVLAVHQDVGDLGIAQQRLQRPEAEYLVQQVGLDLFLLVVVQRHALIGDDFLYDARHSLTRLAGIDARQLLEIQLRDQRPVYLRFIFF